VRATPVAGLLAALLASAQVSSPAGLDLRAFDRSLRPQDDLFMFVNGGWIARTPVPPDRVTYGVVNELGDRLDADLRALIESLSAERTPRPGSPEQQIADLYASLMDEDRLETLGDTPIRGYLEQIANAATPRDFAAVAGYLSSVAAGGPFSATVAQDGTNPHQLVVHVTQGGTLLPDRESYLSEIPAFREVRGRYQEYLERIFRLTRRADPAKDAEDVLALEVALARIQLGTDESRTADPQRVPLPRLEREMPGFGWLAWARPQGIDRAAAVIFEHPAFFRRFAALVPEIPLSTWKAWLAARVITQAAPFLNNALADARFEFFGRVLSGQEAPIVRWKWAVGLVNGYLGDAIGRLYVEQHFPPEAKARVETIAAAVIAAFREAVGKSSWMSDGARREALRKLGSLRARVGYPSVWRDYRGLVIQPDDLVGNVRRAQQFENEYRLVRIGRVDRGEWVMSPQSVNAYYAPALNEIVLPAGLLQPPLFAPDADDAVNFGAIGAVIGHEVSHALDERGRSYDADGAVRDWWTAQDEQEFRRRGALLVEQFSAFSPAPGLFVDGRRTLGENIGDLVGLSTAWRAYARSPARPDRRSLVQGFTAEQRFFLGWAQVWRSKTRPEYLRQWLGTSPYPPFQYRVNGPVSHMAEFYEAFGVKPGDRMFLEAGKRVVFW
jgi:predicted metalloendopeptidase